MTAASARRVPGSVAPAGADRGTAASHARPDRQHTAPVRSEAVVTAAQMVRRHNVPASSAAACLRVSVAEVMIELGLWTSKRGRA